MGLQCATAMCRSREALPLVSGPVVVRLPGVASERWRGRAAAMFHGFSPRADDSPETLLKVGVVIQPVALTVGGL